ncbi:hypothetical protein [Nevskia ramosa]|uniref:hypothetical protein n=1 Tax=Nevskia ramosa TaxID=64002 RepID=UPI0023580038|nr:hypothetical protein [Nevskia ramosa]
MDGTLETRLVINSIGRDIFTTVCVQSAGSIPSITLILGKRGEPSVQAPLLVAVETGWYHVSVIATKYSLADGDSVGQVRIEHSGTLNGILVEEIDLNEAIKEFKAKDLIGNDVGQPRRCNKSIRSESTKVHIEKSIRM